MNRQPSADRLTAVLTFVLLAGGTAAVGAALFDVDRPAPRHAARATVQLPAVEVTGRRPVALADAVQLPAVQVTGRRDAPLSALVAKAPVVSLPAVTVTGRRAEPLVTAASAQSLRVRTSASAAECADVPAPARGGQDA